MTDRELLEAAAKAYGDAVDFETGDAFGRAFMNSNREWNPLTDDGDALRLAVKLRLHVDIHRTGSVTAWVLSGEGARDFEEDQADPYAATRRAVVRAAAAIVAGRDGGAV